MFARAELRQLRNQGRIHWVIRHVTSEEEQMVFVAADVARLRYDGVNQMSGVLAEVVKAGLELALPDVGLKARYKNGLRNENATFRENHWTTAKQKILDFRS